ncbi:ROK family transcriptional regulator [Agromyces larvae]|uniref:ROK family transcriptional regulator n=1 Tax=Agromyces larvae TaxID=2929802 RepID=A0ABY4BWW2_9MICO|nr:ROK family transcriptional regulator [Agromyces larvae]UOE43639.1 ROK family transcriptional regulator [Agromyces larvae]
MTPFDSSSPAFDRTPIDGARVQHSIALLDHLVAHGPTTRSELASATGLGRSAITGIAARLIDAGVLVEQADASGDGRAVPLALSAADHVLVTAWLAPHAAIATVAALSGEEAARFADPFARDGEAAAPVDLLATVLTRALAHAGRAGHPVADLTVVVDGQVAGRPAVAVGSERLGAEPFDLLGELRKLVPGVAEVERGGRTARLVPAGQAAALAECEARGEADLFSLDGDGGIDSAVVDDGVARAGAHGLAASLAHLPIEPNGPRCACGQRGCLANLASARHVLEHAGLGDLDAQAGRTRALDELVRRIDAGDDRARWAWLDAAHAIGRALQVVVPVLDPPVIVVGGYWGDLLDEIDTSFRSNRPTIASGALTRVPRIEQAVAGPDAALVGARRLARDRLIADPVLLAG